MPSSAAPSGGTRQVELVGVLDGVVAGDRRVGEVGVDLAGLEGEQGVACPWRTVLTSIAGLPALVQAAERPWPL